MAHQTQKSLHQLIKTKRLFFSLACLWAAVAPLLFILSLNSTPIIHINVTDHGRGLLFGFTSALITGYLGGSRPVYEVRWLMFLWCITRLVEVLTHQTLLCHWLYVIYGVHLAIIIAPKFWSSKKIRNWLISPVLGLLLCFPVLIYLWYKNINPREWMFVFIQVLSLLMFFMAGRMMVPIINRNKRIYKLPILARVQPYVEGWIMFLFICSIVLRSLTIGSSSYMLQMMLITNYLLLALLICMRIWRWKLGKVLRRDFALVGLLIGYLWLVIGQLMFAYDVFHQQLHISSLHVITVGSLGINSSIIMTLAVAKRRVVPKTVYIVYLLAISGATVCRFLPEHVPKYSLSLLAISALLWCLNYLLVFYQIILKNK